MTALFFVMRPDQTFQEYSAAKTHLGKYDGLLTAEALQEAADNAFAADDQGAGIKLRSMEAAASRRGSTKHTPQDVEDS